LDLFIHTYNELVGGYLVSIMWSTKILRHSFRSWCAKCVLWCVRLVWQPLKNVFILLFK